MAKIKMNDRVKVIDNSKTGKVVDIKTEKDGQHVIKSFGVLLDDFKTVHYYSKKALVPLTKKKKPEERVYPKQYVYTGVAEGGRKITVVGLVDKFPRSEAIATLQGFYIQNVKMKELRIGYSICHPDDLTEYSHDKGVKIAKRRCYERPMTILESMYLGEFREDLVFAILMTKFEYIKQSIENEEGKFFEP